MHLLRCGVLLCAGLSARLAAGESSGGGGPGGGGPGGGGPGDGGGGGSDPAPGDRGGGMGMWIWLFPILLLVFLIWSQSRAQKRERQQRDAMIGALKVGDKVVTIGGMHGVVTKKGESTVDVKVNEQPGGTITFNSTAIASVGGDGGDGPEKKD